MSRAKAKQNPDGIQQQKTNPAPQLVPPAVKEEFPPGWDPNSFASFEIQIKAQNLTTRMDFQSPEAIKITEFLPEGLVIEAKSGNAAKGHHILMEAHLQLQNTPGTTPLHLTAKVEELETPIDDPETVIMHLIFFQFDPKEWETFQNKFSGRQAEIIDFFKAAKGEE